jgi:3-oxoadipate CoA-transferase beta subunit
MDLAIGARRLWVLMEHTRREGAPRLVRRCTYPLTAPGTVRRIYTNLAVIDVTPLGFRLCELAPGVDAATVQARTDAPLLLIEPDDGGEH